MLYPYNSIINDINIEYYGIFDSFSKKNKQTKVYIAYIAMQDIV